MTDAVSPSIQRLLSATATKKVVPGIVSGKRGEATAGTDTIACALPLALRGDTLRRPELQSPYKKFETFVTDTTLAEGDILTINGKDYIIRLLDDYPHRQDHLIYLVLEDEESHA